jgi:hypothetical protein
MKNDYTVNDQLDHLTVLYHRGCKQGFKFFGDDPEEHKYYIKEEHIQLLKDTFGGLDTLPVDYLRRFYAHSRCLVFTSGVWMSETARYPQYLRFRPGANLSFRISGLTRFTSLTDGGGALCVGIDPDAKEMPCLRRFVHVIDKNTMMQPMYSNSYLIPTENCVYGKKEYREGSIFRSNDEPVTVTFQNKGYLIEYTEEPFTMEEAVLNYAGQWITKHIEVFDR